MSRRLRTGQSAAPSGSDFTLLTSGSARSRDEAPSGGGWGSSAARVRRALISDGAENPSHARSVPHSWLPDPPRMTQQSGSDRRHTGVKWLRHPTPSASLSAPGGDSLPSSEQFVSGAESRHPFILIASSAATDRTGARHSDWTDSDGPDQAAAAFQKRAGLVAPTGRARRLWSRVSSAATWLPRMASRKLRGLRRWMSNRRAQWSRKDEGPSEQPYQQYEQHQGQQQNFYQNDQQQQQLVPLERSSPAVGGMMCKCKSPPRKRHRSAVASNALGQFLSTSFWIPALGLVYLLGLSR